LARLAMLPSTQCTVSASRGCCFRGSIPSLCAPLSTLHRNPRGFQRMTRGQCGSLDLHWQRLALFTPCRSPGARIVNLAERGCLFRSPPGLTGQHNRQAKEFPNPSRHATDKTSIPRPLKSRYRYGPPSTPRSRSLPAIAMGRNVAGPGGRLTRHDGVGVLAKITTHRCRPGLSVRRIVSRKPLAHRGSSPKLFVFNPVTITGA